MSEDSVRQDKQPESNLTERQKAEPTTFERVGPITINYERCYAGFSTAVKYAGVEYIVVCPSYDSLEFFVRETLSTKIEHGFHRVIVAPEAKSAPASSSLARNEIIEECARHAEQRYEYSRSSEIGEHIRTLKSAAKPAATATTDSTGSPDTPRMNAVLGKIVDQGAPVLSADTIRALIEIGEQLERELRQSTKDASIVADDHDRLERELAEMTAAADLTGELREMERADAPSVGAKPILDKDGFPVIDMATWNAAVERCAFEFCEEAAKRVRALKGDASPAAKAMPDSPLDLDLDHVPADMPEAIEMLRRAQGLLGAANNALAHQASLLSAKDRELAEAHEQIALQGYRKSPRAPSAITQQECEAKLDDGDGEWPCKKCGAATTDHCRDLGRAGVAPTSARVEPGWIGDVDLWHKFLCWNRDGNMPVEMGSEYAVAQVLCRLISERFSTPSAIAKQEPRPLSKGEIKALINFHEYNAGSAQANACEAAEKHHDKRVEELTALLNAVDITPKGKS